MRRCRELTMKFERFSGKGRNDFWLKLNIAKTTPTSHAGLFTSVKQCPVFFPLFFTSILRCNVCKTLGFS